MDLAGLLISRALTGTTGKVEIGGRQFTFSCIPVFRLQDDDGRMHECADTAGLLRTIRDLLEKPPATLRQSP
jgi:hypothetical protein